MVTQDYDRPGGTHRLVINPQMGSFVDQTIGSPAIRAGEEKINPFSEHEATDIKANADTLVMGVGGMFSPSLSPLPVPISDKHRQQFNEEMTVDKRTSLPPIGRANIRRNMDTIEPNVTVQSGTILYDDPNNDSIVGVHDQSKKKSTTKK